MEADRIEACSFLMSTPRNEQSKTREAARHIFGKSEDLSFINHYYTVTDWEG